jgi:hypothetical protein
MIELVKQRGMYDCGVACLAMALHTTYDDALALLGRDPNDEIVEFEGCTHAGVVPEEFAYAAFKRGVLHIVVPVFSSLPVNTWAYAWKDVLGIMSLDELAACAFADSAEFNAVLGVPSLNNEVYAHWIVVEDGVVFDPSLGKRYKTGDELPLYTAVLFERNV